MKSNHPFYFICLIVILFSTACKSKKNDDPNNIIVQDTTPLGKQIGEISIKIGKDTSNADLFNERAKLHLKRMDFMNAITDLTHALALDTTKADYYLTMADAQFAAAQSGKSKFALEKCLQLEPNNLAALEKMAELYFYVRQYETSISYLDKILKQDIGNPKAYFMKGMNFKEKGDSTRAIGSFQTAIEQKSDYYDAYQQLGMIYTAQNNPLGIQYFDGALRLKPKSVESLYGRGMCYQEVKKDYDKAIQDYTSATLIDPKFAPAYFALGYIHFVYLKMGSEAVKHYTKAIEVTPEWPEAFYNRGLALETIGDIGAAKKDYEQALKLKPGYVLAQQGFDRVKQ